MDIFNRVTIEQSPIMPITPISRVAVTAPPALPIIPRSPADLRGLDGYHVELAPEAAQLFRLAASRDKLKAKTGGVLCARDRGNLIRLCKRFGYNRYWTAYVLGEQVD